MPVCYLATDFSSIDHIISQEMQKITPFLWFNDNAEEAIRFYTKVFPEAKILSEQRIGPAGHLITATFSLFGQEFIALNGGPMFNFTEAVSFVVHCEGQEEVDYYWNLLCSEGGTESRCGWLKDRFGLSWQIIPGVLGTLLGQSDPAKAQAAMQAMLQMNKIDIAALIAASNNAG